MLSYFQGAMDYLMGVQQLEALWSTTNCPINIVDLEGFMNTAMACYLCYFPIPEVAVQSVFFVLIIAVHIRFQIRPGKKSEQKELAYMHRGAKFLCLGPLILDIIRGWSSPSSIGIALHLTEAVAWLVISIALQREETNGLAIYGSIVKAWWVAFLGLSTVGLSAAVVNGRILDAGLESVPLISSLLLVTISFSGHVYKDRRIGNVAGFGSACSPLLSEYSSQNINVQVTPQSESDFSRAGPLSVLTFSWLNRLLAVGDSRPLTILDVPLLDPVDAPKTNHESFEEQWNRQRLQTDPRIVPSMWWTLLKSFWRPFTVSFLLILLVLLAQFSAPLLQNLLIKFIEDEHRTFTKGFTLVLGLVIGKMADSIFGHQLLFRSRNLGLRIWAGVGCAVYGKSLRLSLKARQVRSVGEITNIMSVDLQRLLDLVYYTQEGLLIPLEIIVAVIILFNVVGTVAMLAGLSSLVVVLVVNSFIVRRMRTYRAQLLASKDKRMRATTECVGNLKVIKLQAWDEMFKERIERIREEERSWIQKFMYTWASVMHMVFNGPLMLSGATFFAMVLLGEPLTAARVYTVLTVFKIIQEPIRFIPDIIANLIQSTVSLQRIGAFLMEDEVDEEAVERNSGNNSDYAVDIKGAAFTWDKMGAEPALKDLSLKIKRGSCVAICGAVGSGKSTLLYCIMGELPKLVGTAKLSGRLAYVAQSAWIQNDTIRQNILFGRAMDPNRYKEAVRVSGLEYDLTQFPEGDDTEIGERGTTLSGGQKQRVQLARAVYQDADIYLLDDPFSAVDAHTGTFLFEECVKGALREKTVILVTHQVEFLPAVDQIVVMRAPGEIVQKGTYIELVQEGKDFGVFVEALQESLHNVTRARPMRSGEGEALTKELLDSKSERKFPKSVGSGDEGNQKASARHAELSSPGVTSSSLPKLGSDGTGIGKRTKGKLMKEEIRETGRVNSKVIWSYLSRVGNGAPWFLILVAMLTTTISLLCSDLWLASGTTTGKSTDLHFMMIYALFLIGGSMFVLMRTRLVAWTGVATAQAFFTGMLNSIIRAPMSFIDSTPVARILSRSSTDQSAVDLELPVLVARVGNNILSVIGTLLITAYVTPQILFVTFPLGILFVRLQIYYITSSRELSRLTALTEAPVFLHISESIGGATTIRAFQEQSRFADTNVLRLEAYQRTYFHNISAAEWLGFRLDVLGTTLLSSLAILLIFLPNDKMAPGLAGMSLSYGLTLNSVLMRLISSFSMVENRMVSVERIMQYSNIRSEAPTVTLGKRPPSGWPNSGRIELLDLQIRYRPDLPMVLKGVSCVIYPREKVGVVGRTGSGKSTLIQALFRLIEPTGGCILIDGLDVTSIGLNDLRSALGVIPQEPTLFEGSIRSNLDPFNSYSDQQIWVSLDKCQLGQVVRDKPHKLNSQVSEQGENWSVGERQLFCLARALLKHARILVLDEATASVDITTDAVIQNTWRQYFAECTVVSVAHRIPTVIDCDRVLVLDQGHLMENDSPENLLRNENSMFSKMVKEYTSRTEHWRST